MTWLIDIPAITNEFICTFDIMYIYVYIYEHNVC